MNVKSKTTIFIHLGLAFLATIIEVITFSYCIKNSPIYIIIINISLFLIIFYLIIHNYIKSLKLLALTEKLESSQIYSNTIRLLHDSVRCFKHDFDNILTTLGGYIRTNDLKGLKTYYIQLEDDCQKTNTLYTLSPDIINNNGIYSLLNNKYNKAVSKDVKVNITTLLDFSKLKMKIYNFSRILGVLLDNAIEASSECNEKIINITFRDDTKNSRQIILIENTYPNKNVNTDLIFDKGVSGKNEHTGLGLWEVRELVKKTTNVNLYTSKTSKYFSQQLEIYY